MSNAFLKRSQHQLHHHHHVLAGRETRVWTSSPGDSPYPGDICIQFWQKNPHHQLSHTQEKFIKLQLKYLPNSEWRAIDHHFNSTMLLLITFGWGRRGEKMDFVEKDHQQQRCIGQPEIICWPSSKFSFDPPPPPPHHHYHHHHHYHECCPAKVSPTIKSPLNLFQMRLDTNILYHSQTGFLKKKEAIYQIILKFHHFLTALLIHWKKFKTILICFNVFC